MTLHLNTAGCLRSVFLLDSQVILHNDPYSDAEPGAWRPSHALQLDRSGVSRVPWAATVKGSQPTLLETLEEYTGPGHPTQTVDLDDGRIQTPTLRRSGEVDREVPEPRLDFPAARLTPRTECLKGGRERQPETCPLTSLPHAIALFANLAISILRLSLVQRIRRSLRDILLPSAACTLMGCLV